MTIEPLQYTTELVVYHCTMYIRICVLYVCDTHTYTHTHTHTYIHTHTHTHTYTHIHTHTHTHIHTYIHTHTHTHTTRTQPFTKVNQVVVITDMIVKGFVHVMQTKSNLPCQSQPLFSKQWNSELVLGQIKEKRSVGWASGVRGMSGRGIRSTGDEWAGHQEYRG